MRVTSLKLANLRALETAEFRFQPGFNLIVGVNGVGKSTILDALCICISRILPSTTESRAKARSFSISDIRNSFSFLNALVSEQRGLCCYCMGRIRNEPTTMKIEHWRCRAHHSGEQLNYRNLLGACRGGEGQPRRLQHCDTRKGDIDLAWNPADPAHCIETRVRYELDGSIRADDADFDGQLNDVLNLNLPVLKNNRKGIYDAVLQWWGSQEKWSHGRVPRERLERELARHDAGVGKLTPYGQVAVWLLGQKLAGMAA